MDKTSGKSDITGEEAHPVGTRKSSHHLGAQGHPGG